MEPKKRASYEEAQAKYAAAFIAIMERTRLGYVHNPHLQEECIRAWEETGWTCDEFQNEAISRAEVITSTPSAD